MTQQIKSKQRVADHGEVFTRPEEVNAMLDLVKDETQRINSAFLEPACGNGNFLIEILKRKMTVVEKEYRKSPREYEFYAVLAMSCIYGIELLEDNVIACRKRLLNYWQAEICRVQEHIDEKRLAELVEIAQFLLELNILHGNALTMKYANNDEFLHFSQWSHSPFRGRNHCLKRHDFKYQYLIENSDQPYQSLKEYTSCYFLDIKNAKPIN